MKKVFFPLLLISLLPSFVKSQSIKEAEFFPEKLENGTLVIEDFENDSLGGLPAEWYNRDGDFRVVNSSQREQSLYQYKICKEDGNKYLHYKGTIVKHLNYPLINKDVNIYETPVLSWQWRAIDLPEGANEDKSGKNDSVASIYVVFDFGHVLFKKVPKSIRYTWSTTLEKGTELSKFFGNQKIVVVESGEGKKGQWITFKRNIVEDYKRLFGDDPPKKPLAILLLSDGDSTGNISIADHDNILLLPSR